MSPVRWVRVPDWADIPGLVHGFCGRRGGVSSGPYADLNLSYRVGDDPHAVRVNWARVKASIGPDIKCVTMHQVHGAEIAVVRGADDPVGDVDALVSDSPGLGLCVLTADCVPILLVAEAVGCVAAVHAGWRGTLAGLVTRVVGSMAARCGGDPTRLRAALGPAIGGCCYEVDEAIVASLEARWGLMPAAVHRRSERPAKAHLDLRAVNRALLVAAGVPADRVVSVGPCTRCTPGEYFSHRGSGTNGATGRQASIVGWQNALGSSLRFC
jgi:YfiH family protein